MSEWTHKPPAGVPLIDGHPQLNDLFCWWPMLEGAGGQIKNIVDPTGETDGIMKYFSWPPTAHSGWRPGRRGQTLGFDGGSDHVYFADETDSRFHAGAADYSFMCWVKLDDLGHGYIFGGMQNSTSYMNCLFFTGTNVRLHWFVRYAGNNYDVYGPSNTMEAFRWYHIAGVINRGNNTAYLYQDGALMNTKNITGLGPLTYHQFKIGTSPLSVGVNSLHGFVDDPRVYKRVVTQNEIRDIMQYPSAAFEMLDLTLLAPIAAVGVAGALVNSRARLKSLVGGGLV